MTRAMQVQKCSNLFQHDQGILRRKKEKGDMGDRLLTYALPILTDGHSQWMVPSNKGFFLVHF